MGSERSRGASLPGLQPEHQEGGLPFIEMGQLERNWLVGERGLWAA